MRLHLGPIPDEFTPNGSWRPIREPGPLVTQLVAIPIGIGMALLVGHCWQWVGLTSSLRLSGNHAGWFLVGLILSLPLLIVVHEALHAIVHPRFGYSRATIIGAWPSRLLFYAHYSGPLTRNRFLTVFAMPFLILTVLPLAAAAVGLLPPAMMTVAAWFSTWNALFACGDGLGFGLVLAQVPRAAVVQNQGWCTYWMLTKAN